MRFVLHKRIQTYYFLDFFTIRGPAHFTCIFHIINPQRIANQPTIFICLSNITYYICRKTKSYHIGEFCRQSH